MKITGLSQFKAKMDKAFADIEAGRYESFNTIDELIEYMNKCGKQPYREILENDSEAE